MAAWRETHQQHNRRSELSGELGLTEAGGDLLGRWEVRELCG